MKEAFLYAKLEHGTVRCLTCPHYCVIGDGKRGICGVRENRGGTLFALNFGKLIAKHVDPIEKKPLFHFFPRSRSYSIATGGCNFHCLFCQNSDISQMSREHNIIYGKECTPEEIIQEARREGCRSISYTYTEPTIFLEYALETMKIAKANNIANVFVSNGFTSKESLESVIPLLDAANIDLKSFKDAFYRKICGGRLAPVLDTIKKYKEAGVWVEVTTLVIPGLNDDLEELKDIAHFIAQTGTEIPWHVTRFHPSYRLLDRPVTPVSTLITARETGFKAGLWFVYTGNVPGEQGENTYCPYCKSILIERYGFYSHLINLEKGRCSRCGKEIPGIWG